MFKKYIGGKIIKSASWDNFSVSVMDAYMNECELWFQCLTWRTVSLCTFKKKWQIMSKISPKVTLWAKLSPSAVILALNQCELWFQLGWGSGSWNTKNTGKYRSSILLNTENVQYQNSNTIEYWKCSIPKFQYYWILKMFNTQFSILLNTEKNSNPELQ